MMYICTKRNYLDAGCMEVGTYFVTFDDDVCIVEDGQGLGINTLATIEELKQYGYFSY